jgi:hypothetical protein
MIASVIAAMEEGVPSQAVIDLCVIAENGVEFYSGMQALLELGDIISDHYDPQEKEPDDGAYDEEIALWGTEGDDFDPPEEWFGEGGPFDPDEDM